MKIRGNSYQEKEPSPTEPVEIKHDNYICVNINGQLLNMPYDPKIKRLKDFVKINGKWCARFETLKKGAVMEDEIIKALKEHDLNPIMLNFEEYAECIENLIARNKELEAELKELLEERN